jgi:hypothetical protein
MYQLHTISVFKYTNNYYIVILFQKKMNFLSHLVQTSIRKNMNTITINMSELKISAGKDCKEWMKKIPCKKGIECINNGCGFDHPIGWTGKKPIIPMKEIHCKEWMKKIPCKKGIECINNGCGFDHPIGWTGKKPVIPMKKIPCKEWMKKIPCKKGIECSNNGCKFDHPSE